ncbi:hypothetical protein MMC20_001382 [Loxospora ochrophaea]|nr:hypothetical protein [Loxospora ochrophaea]
MSSHAVNIAPPPSPTSANLASDLKPPGKAATAVKPCCVCKDEKAARDECMLFTDASDPQQECQGMVEKYRSCMKGFGFNIA